MLIRIVKMEFRKEEVETFKALFETVKFKIRSQPGCQHLELLQGTDITTFFTYSYWDNQEALDQYRHSDLFGTTWKKTKALFNAAPQAWSTTRLHHLDSDQS